MLDRFVVRMGFAAAEPTEEAAAAVIGWFVRHFAEGGSITVEERLGMSEFTLACVSEAARMLAGVASAPPPVPESGSYEWLESFGERAG